MQFDEVEKQPEFASVEERVLERWRDRDVARRSMAPRPGAPLLRCYDGPPTANGRPGVHHVEARVFKDILPRYFTMKGYHVPRRAGWDCHGIPVELEIERELGFTGKPQIEAFGVARFNARCRESVTRYVDDWKRLTERIAYWVDMDDAYWTMSSSYVESVWWSVKTMFDRGLIYRDHRVAPYCPRCGTALSDHEVSQGYQLTESLSVYLYLPLLDGPLGPGGTGVDGAEEGASLLVWTTLPWTVVFSTLAVVGPDIRYVLATGGSAGERRVVLAAELVGAVLGAGAVVLRDVPVEEVVGSHYQAPVDLVGPGRRVEPEGPYSTWRSVVLGDFVSATQGTGIVSTAPAYGEDDMRVARQSGAPVVNGVDADGRFNARMGPFAGLDVHQASQLVLKTVEEAGQLLRTELIEHTFPFCWRCRTPLMYYAKPSWYIATTRFRDRMLEGNAGVDWYPEHIRDGRYGDWLANNVDWAVSRERYWGTPLPLWTCSSCQHVVAVGSLRELGELAGRDLSTLDPHRPFVDEVTFSCPSCADGEMSRTREVMDAWYDSGSMPFAQFGYPHRAGSDEQFHRFFPADYTAEAIDQTRGWWYSLQAIGTILFDRNSYSRALCLGHIVDESGRKMSKSLGNVLDPWDVIGRHGADALRWLLLVDGNPWQPRRLGDESVRQVARKLLLTIWNTYYFFVTYSRLARWQPRGDAAPPVGERPLMDQWVIAELQDVIGEVDRSLAGFDVTTAGRRVAAFVEDVSNWYLRGCRERFWRADGGAQDGTGPAPTDADAEAAFATLYECLVSLCGLLAPFMPFLADDLYENLVRRVVPGAADSVHLTSFPTVDEACRNDDLRTAMATARKLVGLGREVRATEGIPVRCPLSRAVIAVPAPLREQVRALGSVIAAELNVREVTMSSDEQQGVVRHVARPNFRALGPVFGPSTPRVVAAIAAADAATIVRSLADKGWFEVEVDGRTERLGDGMVQVFEEPITGWRISTDGDLSLALDIEVTPDLRRDWLARDLIRLLNDLRRRRGLNITDRVQVRVDVSEDPTGEIEQMLKDQDARIRRDVLAVEVSRAGLAGLDHERLPLGTGEILVDLVGVSHHG